MNNSGKVVALVFMICLGFGTKSLLAKGSTINDPCGMVPPIYTGKVPISRIGLQQTYVFYKDGVETFVIRPGFTGDVDNFGMLIPFPAPPELRKVPDEVFPHIAAAVDPPEVIIDCMPIMVENAAAQADGAGGGGMAFGARRDQVRVLKQEAVGMYEVAVLAAGSAQALKKWMDNHGYQYPKGMDKVCEEYIEDNWCFVAVKTKVGSKSGADPKPGQRNVNNAMPEGSSFDGHVQGMGFRFKTDELVVPMRLSAFNEGDMRNVVYLLSDEPKKIRAIPEEYVMRQVAGNALFDNVTKPLPIRILNGTFKDIPEWERKTLDERRNPYPKNGIAKELFASDLVAVASGDMSLEHEEDEKELLRIGEHFGLRGPEIDGENADALKESRDKAVAQGLELIKGMTMTVIDGDFPREVIANQNLNFATYEMPAQRNRSKNYDSKLHGPAPDRGGVLKIGAIDWDRIDRESSADVKNANVSTTNSRQWFSVSTISIFALFMIVGASVFYWRCNCCRCGR